MNTGHPVSRRSMLRMAGAVLACAACTSRAADVGERKEKEGDVAAEKPKDDGAKPIKHKSATLTVQVTGDGKPIAQADVKVKVGANEDVRVTGDDGTVTLVLPGQGQAKVRILAQGWNSGLGQVELKAGQKNTLKVALTRDR